MDPALEKLGWTEEQWNRICTTVTEEAQKARVAAQVLPVVGPEDSTTIAIPPLTLANNPVPAAAQPWPAANRLAVESNPLLNLTTISVNVPLRGHEIADPELKAALTMFRRAANYVARLEDAIVFNGRGVGANPPIGGAPHGVPPVFTVATDATRAEMGILNGGGVVVALPRAQAAVRRPSGEDLIAGVIAAIGQLEGGGQLGPFACVLGPE